MQGAQVPIARDIARCRDVLARNSRGNVLSAGGIHRGMRSQMSRRLLTLVLSVTAIGSAACAERITRSDEISAIDDTPGTVPWKAVSAGAYDSCAIVLSGTAHCWGSDLVGCSLTGCPVNSRPTLIGGARQFTSISEGGRYHCGILDGPGEAWCWGSTTIGSLGDGVTLNSATPVRVAIPHRVERVSVGFEHACAVTNTGVAYCWGGIGPMLGYDDVDRSALPRPVATTLRFSSISAGTTHTCGIAGNGDAYCWGGGYGTLGIGSRDTACTISTSCFTSAVPQLVDGGLRWASISAGNTVTCGVTVDSRGYCWGAVRHNGETPPPHSRLGNGSTSGSKTPVPISGGFSFRVISIGTRHACGLTTDGAAYCWGSNSGGQLGTGHTRDDITTPQPVVGGLTFTSISVAEPSCGISRGMNLYCWGVTSGGALGNGQSGPGRMPVPTRVLAPAP